MDCRRPTAVHKRALSNSVPYQSHARTDRGEGSWLANMGGSQLNYSTILCVAVTSAIGKANIRGASHHKRSYPFPLLTCVDRLAEMVSARSIKPSSWVQVDGPDRVEFRDATGRPMTATLELRYQRMTVPRLSDSRVAILELCYDVALKKVAIARSPTCLRICTTVTPFNLFQLAIWVIVKGRLTFGPWGKYVGSVNMA
ncbi:hypothetical protein LMG29542_07151 [Paraburkholderia humisilvae]|uniref:Uncharacterized protein n=1 Tax=Paraburkholderia humisilvae TaxID=627669 RepID=A0A6J5F331_9BURK|nr:hypothetical protein LMG29542_07151 [Paraburkholderia humisilvae]